MNKFFNRKVITIIGFTTAILCGCSSTAKNFAETTSSAVDGAAVSESTESVTSMPETEVTTGETEGESAASSKTIEDLVKEAAKIAGLTDEEVESIIEDARVYEAYGSSAEIAADMAIKDAVYGKSNGQQDYAVTLPQVVDENGNPYPTDEYGGVIVPETTAPEETTQVVENETPTATVSEEGKELTYEYTNDELGYTLKVYGDDEVFVVTENDTGEVHKYGNLTEYRNYVSIRDSEKNRDPDLIEWDGKLNTEEDAAMTNEELRQLIDSGYNFGHIQ
jgi:cell division septum initiation protein DivIVA